MIYFETSSKKSININKLLKTIALKAYDYHLAI